MEAQFNNISSKNNFPTVGSLLLARSHLIDTTKLGKLGCERE